MVLQHYQERMGFPFTEEPEHVFFRCVQDCSEAIMISDNQGTMLYVNPAWCKIYEYTQEEAIGKTPALIHSGLHDREFYSKMWRDITHPSIGFWKGEIINQSKSGRLTPVFLTITPFKNATGEPVGYMGFAVDISVQKKLEEQVLRQDRLASIGILAGGLAHEIGTPLGVIRGRAELIKMSIQDPKTLQSLDTIINQSDRISKLISSLLRFSRNPNDIHLDRTALIPLIDEASRLLEDKFKKKEIEFRSSGDPSLSAWIDPQRMEQILINLLINSMQAIDEAKRSQNRSTEQHWISTEIFRGQHCVQIRITDTGCGIPKENMKKLFKPFFTTKDIGEGTGLGLSIVEKLVTEMSGDISFESSVGVGTAVTLSFPETRRQ